MGEAARIESVVGLFDHTSERRAVTFTAMAAPVLKTSERSLLWD
ncbi:MAG: hypothetical protein ABSH08_09805 [Tepidisphaeraceae bacterium]|jgi:hypothetical protein